MIDGLVAGRMYGKAVRRQSPKGQYTLCKIRVVTGGGDVLFVSVITFNDAAGEALLALADGESVALAGELKPKIGMTKKVIKPALDMVARSVLSRTSPEASQAPIANAAGRTSSSDEA